MGSGGGTQTTTQGIDPEFMPYVEKALGIATNRLSGQFDESGNLRNPNAENIVAKLQPEQLAGLNAQSSLAHQALTGKGMYNDMNSEAAKLARQAVGGTGIYNDKSAVQRELMNATGAMQGQRQGALGSARGDRAQQAALGDMAYQFQQGRQSNAAQGADALFSMQKGRQQQAEAGAQSLQDVGSTYQEQSQKIKDAPYTELQRYSNILTGVSPTQSTTSGGGK